MRIQLAASNFAQWFIGVLGRESHILGNSLILGNFAPSDVRCPKSAGKLDSVCTEL